MLPLFDLTLPKSLPFVLHIFLFSLSLSVQAQLLRSSSGGSRSCTTCCHCLTLLGINKVVTEASVWSRFILNIHAIMPAALTHFANSWVCPALCHLCELWVKGCSTVNSKSWNDLHRFWHIFPQLKGIFLPVKKQSGWKMSKYGFAGRNIGAFRFRWWVKTKRWERYTFSAINISALKSQPINLAELSYITISPETLTSITLDLFECGVQCNWTWLVSRLLRRCEQVSVCES